MATITAGPKRLLQKRGQWVQTPELLTKEEYFSEVPDDIELEIINIDPIIQERIIEVPVEVIKEVIIERKVPVYIDKPVMVEIIKEVPIETVKFVEVEKEVQVVKELEVKVKYIPKWIWGFISLESLIILGLLFFK